MSKFAWILGLAMAASIPANAKTVLAHHAKPSSIQAKRTKAVLAIGKAKLDVEIVDNDTNILHSLIALTKKRNDAIDRRSEFLGICECGGFEIDNMVSACEHARIDICSYKELH